MNEYTVVLKVALETSQRIQADSFEEALKKARELKAVDFVETDCANDASIEILGVTK